MEGRTHRTASFPLTKDKEERKKTRHPHQEGAERKRMGAAAAAPAMEKEIGKVQEIPQILQR